MTKRDLIQMATGMVFDADHWSLVDTADRADMGESLARAVLDHFNEPTPCCPADCQECKEHESNLN